MAYRLENTESGKAIILDGVEQGIADTPYAGIADIRCANILSTPGEATVMFKPSALTKPPAVTSAAFTTDNTTDTVTWTPTATLYNGCAITVDIATGGFSTTKIYWVGNVSGSTFKVYKDPTRQLLLDITSDVSGNFTVVQLGQPKYHTTQYYMNTAPWAYTDPQIFFVDANGRAWWVEDSTDKPIFLGNTTLGSGQGIVFGLDYLFVMRSGNIDVCNIQQILGGAFEASISWTYGWKSLNDSSIHQALFGQDRTIYICNTFRIASISENVGTTFAPGTSSSYTYNTSALDLPGDSSTYVAELGTDLLVGTNRNYVYPWDRISPSFRLPLILGEKNTHRIVSTNANAYIFAGNRGRIYKTNGAAVEEWKKIPDHITGYPDPYFTWKDAAYSRNQLVFSFTAEQNDGTDINDFGGLWAIDVTTEAMRMLYKLSPDNYTTVATLIMQVEDTNPGGMGLFIGWDNASAYGIDKTSSTPYTNYETVITWDAIPVGTFLNKRTPTGFEFKLGKNLVSGEGIRLSYRTELTGSFTTIDTHTTAGQLSADFLTNFENAEWIQLRTEQLGTASSPSYVPLREVRILL